MIKKWCREAMLKLTMILASDSVTREFTKEDRDILHEAHSILSRHMDI